MSCLPFQNSQFKAILCTHDTLNYSKNIEELFIIFKECSRVLQTDGIFIFDLATRENVLNNFADEVIEEQHGNLHMLWQNRYDKNEEILKSTISFTNGSGYATIEEHYQKIYSLSELLPVIKDSGFTLSHSCYDYVKENNSPNNSQLRVLVCKKA